MDWAAVAKLAADSTLCRARVTNVLDTGVQLSAFEGIGFIPAGLMDPTRFAKIDASPEERAKLTAKLNGSEIVFKVVEVSLRFGLGYGLRYGLGFWFWIGLGSAKLSGSEIVFKVIEVRLGFGSGLGFGG